MRERSSYSNFRTADPRSSPRRDVIASELDEHSNRIKQLLRADLIMLQEQNSILKNKCKKVGQLQDKVQMVLKQNSQLLSQNQRLSKLLHQKKQEYEILKDKFQVQSSQRLQNASEFDFERKKLINQLDKLENELKEVEHIKNSQINETKSQCQMEINAIKRQTIAAQEIYEQQIRKLKDQLDKKDYEVSDTINRLKRFSSEAEYDILRLKEEKQKLRNELLNVQTTKKIELDAISAKLQTSYLEQIEAIKKNHLFSLEQFEKENIKLKDILQNKITEIEQISNKLNKQKGNYQESLVMTKRQNEILRSKMIQFERVAEGEKDALKIKINRVHQSEIEQMRINQQKYTDCLQAQINKLQSALNKKNDEIQVIIKEKSSVRQMFDSEGNRLKEEIESLQIKVKDLQSKQTQLVNVYQDKIRQKLKHIDFLDKLNQDQLENYENETKTIKQLLDHQKSELDSEKIKNREKEQLSEQLISQLKNQNTTLQQLLSRQKAEKDKQVEEIQYELESTITNLKSKLDSVSSRNSILQRQLNSLKQSIIFKEKQIKNLSERVKLSEQRQKKLERQNDDLRSKLIKKDQKTNEILIEQKQRLQATFTFTLDNLKIDHDSALKLEANRQAELNEKLRKKEFELDELLKAYKKMRDDMQILTEQQANRKQMTLKYPGATADLIATKNLFDVYLKSRVLNICGDVKNKQNSGS